MLYLTKMAALLMVLFSNGVSAKQSQSEQFSIQNLDVSNPDWQPRQLRYSVYLPDELDLRQPAPLIINLHGGGGSEEDLKGFTGLRQTT